MLRLIGVFDTNGIVCTTEGSLVGLFIFQSSFGGARGAFILLVELGCASDWADGIYWLGDGEGCDTRASCGEEPGGACDDARSKHGVGGLMSDD